jgi:hypothetical protein
MEKERQWRGCSGEERRGTVALWSRNGSNARVRAQKVAAATVEDDDVEELQHGGCGGGAA